VRAIGGMFEEGDRVEVLVIDRWRLVVKQL